MKKFILFTFLWIIILYAIIFAISYFFDFHLMNVTFIVGLIACFFTYGGRVSSMSANFGSASMMGGYIPKDGQTRFVTSISPFFIGSLLTFLSAFISVFI